MRTKQHKLILTMLIIYTALILFFLFVSFGRFGPTATVGDHVYRFNLIPNMINLRFPTFSNFGHFQLLFFNLGNFVGFIPFGILIPILYRCNFFKFISLFFLSILIIETVQMLTFLGSFDINDAIVNSLGASVGFGAYKIGFRFTNIWRNFVITAIVALVLSIGVIGFSEVFNKTFTKIEGEMTALNELESNSNVKLDKNLQSFNIGQDIIEPEINMYSSESGNIEIFTYVFGGKDIVLSFNHGIPDHASDHNGQVVISVDGEEVETHSSNGHSSSEMMLEKVNELTITITGNAQLWDVTFKEMKYKWN